MKKHYKLVAVDIDGTLVNDQKEILDETGQVREGCKIIRKGEVYERNIFTTKYAYFKGEGFLNEVKDIYTKLINVYVKDEKEKQKVFDKKLSHRDAYFLQMV